MGYWNAGEDGSSLHVAPTGLVWGDSPADEMDAAITRIVADFKLDVGRYPTKQEIRSGLEFALGRFDTDEVNDDE